MIINYSTYFEVEVINIRERFSYYGISVYEKKIAMYDFSN